MRASVIAIAATLIVAGCSAEPDADRDGDGAISVAEAAEKAASAEQVRPEPGLYRVELEVLEIDVPGAPPGAAQMMQDMMGGEPTEYCLTPEDAAKGYEESLRRSQEGDCSFERFEIDSGAIDARMVCTQPGGATAMMEMTGNATPTSSQMEFTTQGEMGGAGTATLRMRTTQERIGDCPG